MHLDAPGQRHGQQLVSRTADPGVVKQDKSSRGSVDTTKTRSDPQRVRMSSGERPIGAAKGKQPDTEALCQTPPSQYEQSAGKARSDGVFVFRQTRAYAWRACGMNTRTHNGCISCGTSQVSMSVQHREWQSNNERRSNYPAAPWKRMAPQKSEMPNRCSVSSRHQPPWRGQRGLGSRGDGGGGGEVNLFWFWGHFGIPCFILSILKTHPSGGKISLFFFYHC